MNNLLDKIKEISNQFSFDWRVIAAEQLGTEIQFKYNDTIKQRFLSDGSIIATGDVIEFG